MVLSETGSDYRHVIAEEVTAWQSFVLGKATSPGFRDWAVVGLPSLLKRMCFRFGAYCRVMVVLKGRW
jgi:hypothetical protein